MLTKECATQQYWPRGPDGLDHRTVGPAGMDHCWRCHYELCRIYSDDDRQTHYQKSAELVWHSFCNQWLIVGWAMIMGKE